MTSNKMWKHHLLGHLPFLSIYNIGKSEKTRQNNYEKHTICYFIFQLCCSNPHFSEFILMLDARNYFLLQSWILWVDAFRVPSELTDPKLNSGLKIGTPQSPFWSPKMLLTMGDPQLLSRPCLGQKKMRCCSARATVCTERPPRASKTAKTQGAFSIIVEYSGMVVHSHQNFGGFIEKKSILMEISGCGSKWKT
jgi:hypothetical protein